MVKKYLPCVVHRPHCISQTGDVKVTLTAFDPIAGQSNASVEHVDPMSVRLDLNCPALLVYRVQVRYNYKRTSVM